MQLKRFVSGFLILAVSFSSVSHSQVGTAVSEVIGNETLTCEQIVRIGVWAVARSRHAGKVELSSSELGKKAMAKFAEKADPFRLILTESDVNELVKTGTKAWKNIIDRRDCTFIDNWLKTKFPPAVEKFNARLAQVTKKLPEKKASAAKDMASQPKSYFEFAANESELTERLKAWSDEIITTASPKLLKAFSQNKALLVKNTVEEGLFADHEPSRNWIAKAMLEGFDQYSTYFSPTEFQDFYSDLAGGISGVGIRVRKVPSGLLIEKILPDSPASRSKKLKEGEVIIAIDGKKAPELNTQQSKDALTGAEGSKVKLQIATLETNTIRTETLTRQRFTFDDSRLTKSVHKTKGGKNVAVIEIPSFYGRGGMDDMSDERSTSEDFKIALNQALAQKEKPGAVIIDLRGNPGGYLEEAVSLAGVFIGDKPVVGVVESNEKRILNDDTAKPMYNGPVGILVDENTASASEVFALALKDYSRALVLSETPTFGKGSVQRLFHLDDPFLYAGAGGALGRGVVKLTTSLFYSPLGATPAAGGMIPHVVLPQESQNEDEPKPARVAESIPKGEPLVSPQELETIHQKEIAMNHIAEDLKNRLAQRITPELQKSDDDLDLENALMVFDDYLNVVNTDSPAIVQK